MAKALLGHLGGTDVHTTGELTRLRLRVKDLESLIIRLQAENDALAAAAEHDELLTYDSDQEPALA
jgi:hypothetical protein